MAITPLPLEDAHDDRASQLPQELQCGNTQDVTTLPADNDPNAGEGTRAQYDPARGADAAVPQLAGDWDGGRANGEDGATLEVAGHIDTEVSAEPVAQQEGFAPPPPADSIEATDEELPSGASLVPLIEAPPAAGAVSRALLDALSHLPLPPALEVQVALTAAAPAATPRILSSTADDGPGGEPATSAAGDGTDPVAPATLQVAPNPSVPPNNVIDAALKLTADANAAAEALENLKRLLDRGPPAPPIGRTPAMADARATYQPAPRPVPARAVNGTAAGQAMARPLQPLTPSPPAPGERRRLDVHGFLAGFAMSLAFGALLYLLLAAG